MRHVNIEQELCVGYHPARLSTYFPSSVFDILNAPKDSELPSPAPIIQTLNNTEHHTLRSSTSHLPPSLPPTAPPCVPTSPHSRPHTPPSSRPSLQYPMSEQVLVGTRSNL
ncbi:hypothetical protein BDQ12DRAFT_692863 [Crucibulum laeve]|uniref:Uncharacterized protein n=1 Tax=Crucibulum laeve TaxID=68775 RepID=A0A5C3LIZ7_9AGAR|nr:hypothetical protein BDQ12DRAFT_692863 [Crucibulum laeve]